MNCQEARKYFSPWLDGEKLTTDEADALNTHIKECDFCAGELEKLWAITTALGQMRVSVKPPKDFAAKVMERLRIEAAASGTSQFPAAAAGESKMSAGTDAAELENGRNAAGKIPAGWLRGIRAGWKRSIAVAAAFLLLLSGSIGMAARYSGGAQWFGPPALIIAQGDTGQDSGKINSIGKDNGTGCDAGNEPNKSSGNIPESDSSEGNANPVDRADTGKAGQSPGDRESSSGEETKRPALIAQAEPKEFLNQPRAIESLFLKVKVSNLDSSVRQLEDLAKAGGTSSFSVNQNVQVDGDKNVEIFQFKVPQVEAEQFCAYVNSMGQVISSKRETRDISGEFATKLNRYQSLLAEKNTSSKGQSKVLDAEIRNLEEELTTLDNEVHRQLIVIVWLER